MQLSQAHNFNAFRPELVPLLAEYVKSLNKKKGDDNIFDPWFILQNVETGRKVVNELIKGIDYSEIDGVCVLANSGVPLGILFSLAINKPMYFYNRETWSIGDNKTDNYFIYPIPPLGSRVTIIDSHIDTGFTSCDCYALLQKRNIKVTSIIAPISFLNETNQDSQKYLQDTNYCFLAEANDIKEILLSSFECEDIGTVEKIMKLRIEEDIPTIDFDERSYSLSKKELVKATISSLFHVRQVERFFDTALADKLSTIFRSNEESVWSFFTQSSHLCETFSQIGSKVLAEEYDVLVGTGFLGTVFAICYAWVNNFNGVILSTYKTSGWSNIDEYIGKSCLIISGRLQSSYYLRRTIKLLNAKGIRNFRILVMRYAPENVDFSRRLIVSDFLRIYKDKIFIIS